MKIYLDSFWLVGVVSCTSYLQQAVSITLFNDVLYYCIVLFFHLTIARSVMDQTFGYISFSLALEISSPHFISH